MKSSEETVNIPNHAMRSSDSSGKTTLLHLLPSDDVTGNVNSGAVPLTAKYFVSLRGQRCWLYRCMYIIKGARRPLTPPSLISLMVSVDVKHHVYLLTLNSKSHPLHVIVMPKFFQALDTKTTQLNPKQISGLALFSISFFIVFHC